MNDARIARSKKRTDPAMPAVPIVFRAGGGSIAPGVRAQWVTQRLNEMPQLIIFLYNALIDAAIEWRFKHHMFSTLRYVFDPVEGVVPPDHPLLARVDDLCLIYRCLGELNRTMHPAQLALYIEVLHREDIDLHKDLVEAPWYLGGLYAAIADRYPSVVEKLRGLAGNVIKTGELVEKLRAYLDGHRRQAWASERMLELERLLESYG